MTLAGLATVAAILIPAGSATTTAIKPYTANLCDLPQLTTNGYLEQVCPEGTTTPPALPGGSAVVYLTFHNKANPQSLGSANVGLPTGPSGLTYDTGHPAEILPPGTGTVTTASSLIKLRNLNLASGRSLTIKLTLNTPVCTTGTYSWSGRDSSGVPVIQVKQSNEFQGPPGNDFTRVAPSSLTAALAGGCHLAVVSGHQPQDTVKNQPITDALYSSGGPVQVELYDSSNNLVQVDGSCPLAPGCVAVSASGGDPTATLGGTSSQPLVDGIASFGDLSLDKSSSTLYRLSFTSPGVIGTTSDDFPIVDTGVLCNPGQACSLPGTFGGTGPNSTTTTTVSTTFDTAGGLSLTFFTAGLHAAVTGPGGGCENFKPTDSAGVTLNIHGSAGTTFIDYGISDKALKKRYGPNYGQPQVPICVGAQRADVSGNTIPCETDAAGAWTGKKLGSDGKLNGQFKLAVCDAITHLWWSVAPTFQDDPSPPGFPPLEILISAWGGTTASDGTNLRVFTIEKPNPWDYQMRG